MANKDIFEAFHKTLINEEGNNNTWWLYNEDKTALIIYTESDPYNINRMLIERKGGEKYIDIDKVKQAINKVSNLRLESGIKGNIIDDEIYIDSMDVLNILDKLIAESEEK